MHTAPLAATPPAAQAIRRLARTPVRLWHSFLLVFVFGGLESTQAQTLALSLSFRPLAAAASFSQGVNLIWTVIIVIAFIIGAVVAFNGWMEKQRGEDGNKKLIAGIGAPLSLIALKAMFQVMFPNAGISQVQEQSLTQFDQ